MTDTPQNKTTNEDKPLVTFALFAYKQEKYIREAVASALAQTYSPLQIILSDDCSPDATFEIMKQMVADYNGPHKVILNRNNPNLGVADHVNKVVDLAAGALIVMQAGDDISFPYRVAEFVEAWQRFGSAAICCNAVLIDGNSEEVGTWRITGDGDDIKNVTCDLDSGKLNWISFYGAGAAYDKRVFTEFEKLPRKFPNEDGILPWRAAVMSGVTYLPNNLIKYRTHDNNLSHWGKMRFGTIKQRLSNFKKREMVSLKNAAYVYENVFAKRHDGRLFTKVFYDFLLISKIHCSILDFKFSFALISNILKNFSTRFCILFLKLSISKIMALYRTVIVSK